MCRDSLLSEVTSCGLGDWDSTPARNRNILAFNTTS